MGLGRESRARTSFPSPLPESGGKQRRLSKKIGEAIVRILEPYLPQPQSRAAVYITVRQRFALVTVAALVWMALSAVLAQPWSDELALVIGAPAAWLLIALIALVPGFLNAHLVLSLLVDRPPKLPELERLPPVTVLIAAWNERDSLPETVRAFSQQRYPGQCELVIVDDGSTDGTVDALDAVLDLVPGARIVTASHGGKAAALNVGLMQVRTPVVVTMDADTRLHPGALRRLVTRLVTAPPDTAAVAGMVLARNSRANLLTRMQEWDYFLAMASVKRQQALYQGTLVAQGAFSAYKTQALREASGWPASIGEDIVLTWALQKAGYRIGFEPSAMAFTTVPITWRGFVRQRRRWARGMIEGLAAHGELLWRRPRLTGFFVFIDALFPLIDGAYSLVFLPGVALALFGHYYIAGPMTLLVIPVALLVTMVMLWRQSAVFRDFGLHIRRNRLGYIGYLLTYQAILSPVALVGYAQEFLHLRKRW